MTNMDNVYDKIKRSVQSAAEKYVYDLAQTLQSGLLHEFQNDLVFSGHGKDRDVLSQVQVSVNQTSDDQYRISLDLKGLTENQKELFEFYFNNAKTRALTK